jgi:hypothetical protein
MISAPLVLTEQKAENGAEGSSIWTFGVWIVELISCISLLSALVLLMWYFRLYFAAKRIGAFDVVFPSVMN